MLAALSTARKTGWVIALDKAGISSETGRLLQGRKI